MKDNPKEKTIFQPKIYLGIFLTMLILLEGALFIGWIGSERFLQEEYVIVVAILLFLVSIIITPLIMLRLDIYRTWFESRKK